MSSRSRRSLVPTMSEMDLIVSEMVAGVEMRNATPVTDTCTQGVVTEVNEGSKALTVQSMEDVSALVNQKIADIEMRERTPNASMLNQENQNQKTRRHKGKARADVTTTDPRRRPKVQGNDQKDSGIETPRGESVRPILNMPRSSKHKGQKDQLVSKLQEKIIGRIEVMRTNQEEVVALKTKHDINYDAASKEIDRVILSLCLHNGKIINKCYDGDVVVESLIGWLQVKMVRESDEGYEPGNAHINDMVFYENDGKLNIGRTGNGEMLTLSMVRVQWLTYRRYEISALALQGVSSEETLNEIDAYTTWCKSVASKLNDDYERASLKEYELQEKQKEQSGVP
uniref:PM2 protein n=1 Tax=La France disease virus TaxID=28373 RepID=Q83037_9VIRU|nr:pM2 [La France disease virus]prf//1906228A M2 dsRNA ORF [Agaricus bisporus]